MILAIDPGNIESAYVVLDEDLKPIRFKKINNNDLLEEIKSREFDDCNYLAIEMIASYGMAVGKTVFETCVWIGRFAEALDTAERLSDTWVYRKDAKLNLCHSTKAKDSNVIQALKDRFAPNTKNNGKGTKKEPGFFYGFAADVWQAYAVGVTYHDIHIKNQRIIEF